MPKTKTVYRVINILGKLYVHPIECVERKRFYLIKGAADNFTSKLYKTEHIQDTPEQAIEAHRRILNNEIERLRRVLSNYEAEAAAPVSLERLEATNAN